MTGKDAETMIVNGAILAFLGLGFYAFFEMDAYSTGWFAAGLVVLVAGILREWSRRTTK